MDKLLIKLLKEIYPHLHITVILRGKDVVNDATIEDAREIGLTEVAKCIGNGTAYPGTILDEISSEARELLDQADLIIAKGQGNFESLYGEGLNPYYMFLCKCDYFVQRFELEKFSPVVIKEEDLKS